MDGNAPATSAAPAAYDAHVLTGVRGKLARAVILSDACLLSIIFTVLPPVLPPIAANFGGGKDGAFIAQLVMTMPSLGLMLGGTFSGWLVSKAGARSTLIFSLLAFAVLGSAGMYVNDANTLIASRFLLGLNGSVVATAAGYLVGVFVAPENRARAVGYRNFFGSAVGVVGTYAAGPIADLVGWRATFALYLVTAAVLFLLAVTTIPRGVPTPIVAPSAPVEDGFLKRFLPIYLWIIPFAIIMMINGAQLSFLLSADGVTSPTVQSWVIGLGGIFSATGSASYGFLRSKLGSKVCFALVPICLGGGTFIVGLTHNLWIQALGAGITGLGCGIIVPHFYTMIYDRATPANLSRALGWMLTAMFFGDFLNPFVLGTVMRFMDIHAMFVCVGLVIASLAVSPWLFRGKAT